MGAFVKPYFQNGGIVEQQEKLLLARIDDKLRETERTYDTSFLGFLTPGEQVCARRYLSGKDAAYRFDGGYPDAERTLLLIKPDNDAVPFRETGEFLTALRISSFQEGKALGHRDYLGSLIGSGLKREVIGDILPYTDGKIQHCDVLLLKSVGRDALMSLERIGRSGVRVEEIPPEHLHVPEKSFREIRDTVASARLDAVVSSGFSIGRNEAKELCRKGLVSLNYEAVEAPDVKVGEGDVISARGYGKIRLAEIGGETKKQRIRIVIQKYI